MEISKFNKLITHITGMSCEINDKYNYLPENGILEAGCDYFIEVNEKGVLKKGFIFGTPKNMEKLVQNFLTQFCKKLKKQLPEYEGNKIYDLGHHCFSDFQLKNILIDNFSTKVDFNIYCRYALYPTKYGIGISTYLIDSQKIKIDLLFDYLDKNNIPYRNEFSEKEFAFRFIISKDIEFNKSILTKI